VRVVPYCVYVGVVRVLGKGVGLRGVSHGANGEVNSYFRVAFYVPRKGLEGSIESRICALAALARKEHRPAASDRDAQERSAVPLQGLMALGRKYAFEIKRI